MGYDIDIGGTCPHCKHSFTEYARHTSNTAPMWRAAGCDLSEFNGKTAAELLPSLTAAIAAMLADPERYRAMEPENGWGSYDSTLRFLNRLRELCEAAAPGCDRVEVCC